MESVSRKHPYGVQPSGNAYFMSSATTRFVSRKNGLGGLSVLKDAFIMKFLAEYMDAASLIRLSSCSKALYCVVNAHDALWKDQVVAWFERQEAKSLDFKFHGSWRSTFHYLASRGTACHRARHFGYYFSDALYQPNLFARATVLDKWLSRDNVARECASSLSLGAFVDKYEVPGLPCVIKESMKSWNSVNEWSLSSLCDMLGDKKFRVGPFDVAFSAFADYVRNHREENPLYLFDCKFGEKCSALLDGYKVPKYFCGKDRDLFASPPAEKRPDFRWLILGAAKSGSKWHVDPNKTSAWNAAIFGRKKWIMLPPGCPPPGVRPSPDGGFVAQPVSLMEWFSNYYDAMIETVGDKVIEFVAEPGECVFVPSGWWHCVLNLDVSCAITQNYVSSSNLAAALRFFDRSPDLISGIASQDVKCNFLPFFALL